MNHTPKTGELSTAQAMDATAGAANQMAANMRILGSALCPSANLGNRAANNTSHMIVANPKNKKQTCVYPLSMMGPTTA